MGAITNQKKVGEFREWRFRLEGRSKYSFRLSTNNQIQCISVVDGIDPRILILKYDPRSNSDSTQKLQTRGDRDIRIFVQTDLPNQIPKQVATPMGDESAGMNTFTFSLSGNDASVVVT